MARLEEVHVESLPTRLLNVQVPWVHLNPDKVVHVPCVLCGTFRYETLASLIINRMEFFLVQCQTCGLIWRNPIPDQSFFRDLYSDKYYNVAEHCPDLIYQVGIADSRPEDWLRRTRIGQKQVQEWLESGILQGTDSVHTTGRLLEIGGGRGYLQRAAAEAGWETVGLEISPYGIREAIERGLMVLPVTLDELSEKFVPYSGYFDMAALYDFLEHIVDPVRTLRIVNHVLKSQGTLALRIPDTRDCPKLHLVDHIWHFSSNTLRLVLEREGFEILHQHESGVFEAPHQGRIQNITVFARKVS